MITSIAMHDLGNDVYLWFTSGDVASLRASYGENINTYLGMNDPEVIMKALSYGLKRSDGVYIRDTSPYGPLNLDDIPVPLVNLKARISQALQRPITG